MNTRKLANHRIRVALPDAKRIFIESRKLKNPTKPPETGNP